MSASRTRTRAGSERGQTLVEFALVLPVLATLLLAIIEFGVVFHDYVTVTDASRVGARKAAVSRFVADFGESAETAAKNSAQNLNEDLITADCTSTDWSTPGSDVTCTVTYPYSINVLGMEFMSGLLTSETTERLE